MIKAWTNNASETRYTLALKGTDGNIITCPTQVTEEEANKIMSLVNGIINQRTNTTQGIQWAEPKAQAETPKAEKAQDKKAKAEKFPALKLVEKIGFLSVYEGMLVRQWSETGYTPEKVKFGLKKAIQEAGATWDDANKAYKFAKKADYNTFIKAQKAREHANK